VFTKKASNFASKCELGRLPIISFITSLTFKYYSRLKELPSTRLVTEAFEVDKGLFNSGQKSWYCGQGLVNMNMICITIIRIDI
jgi:hypothetical protein